MAEKNRPDEPKVPGPRPGGELAPFVKETDDGKTPPPGAPGGPPFQVGGRVSVSLTRSEVSITDDAALWSAIRNRTDAIRGDRYEDFITRVLCETGDAGLPVCKPGAESTPT